MRQTCICVAKDYLNKTHGFTRENLYSLESLEVGKYRPLLPS